MIEIKEKKIMLGDKEAIIRLGEYAHQANGSVCLQCGETIVHAVVTMGEENPDLDFFPLSVEYNESLYAGGLIKSSRFIKREGRPSDEAILKCRLIDRSIRPMFPKDFKREVQLVINVLSSDKENPHDVLSLTASIIAIAVSDIPFDSNIGGLRLSKVEDKFIINPKYSECEKQDFELVLAGNGKKIIMIECGANCISDDEVLKGFEYSFEYLGKITATVKEIENEYGKKKIEYTPDKENEEIINKISKVAEERIEEYYQKLSKKEINRKEYTNIVIEPVLALFNEEEIEEISKKVIVDCLDKIFKKRVRENILKNSKRVDGRDLTEIRDIEIRINPIPCVHGSSMFQRGETQVLNILTLAAPGYEQLMESIEGETKKRYIHHYNAPPYSVGEVGRIGSPGRREIGHGALAEKALMPVLPLQENFPYVIRLVSEVMGQNGSSSMASTCASTITLMAGGVPIKKPVAGISIGLMTGDSDDDFVTITDIRGIEDFSGDMDFKIAGTYDEITAIQMDTKIKGLTFDIIKKSFMQAKEARRFLLSKILEIIPESMNDISERAPRIETLNIPIDLIGKVIGPSGKIVKQLSADYEVEISIEEDGRVNISGTNRELLNEVKRVIEGIVHEPEVGNIYPGKITKLMDFGAFVEIFPGKEGLIHISRISKEHVKNVNDVLSLDQKVEVKLINIDAQGRLNFSMILDDNINNNDQNDKRRKFVQTDKRK